MIYNRDLLVSLLVILVKKSSANTFHEVPRSNLYLTFVSKKMEEGGGRREKEGREVGGRKQSVKHKRTRGVRMYRLIR